MASIAAIFDSSKEQSILSRAVGLAKYSKNYQITSYDTKGLAESPLASLIATIAATTHSRVMVHCGTQATYSAAGLLTYDQIASLDAKLITANKGTVVISGTCGSHSTATEIVLTGADVSTVDDHYNGMYIKTAGTTAVYRYITDYVGSTKTCTVATTTTPITTTETFIIYTNACIDLIGDADSTKLACRVAWDTLFPTVHPPMLIQIMGGYDGSTFAAYKITGVTADSAATSNGISTLSKSAYFTASAQIDKWLGIISGTTGGGEVHQILSNTTGALTLTEIYKIVPTGTIVFQICDTKEWCLANYSLPYAIKAYLQLDNAKTNKILKSMLDKYNILQNANTKQAAGDDQLVLTYVQRGKCIFDYASL